MTAQVRYIVDDVGASIDFYTRALAFKVAQDYRPAMAILTRQDLTLWVAGPTASASRPMPDGTKPAPGGWARFVLSVDDLDGMIESLTAAGVKFRSGLITGPGGRQILCEDPSGNAIELFQPG